MKITNKQDNSVAVVKGSIYAWDGGCRDGGGGGGGDAGDGGAGQ